MAVRVQSLVHGGDMVSPRGGGSEKQPRC